jgi:hypothetical protein
MAGPFYDLVQETTLTQGTGPVLCTGTALPGFVNWSSVPSGSSAYYYIRSGDGYSWELGLAPVTVSGGSASIPRTGIIASSNGGAAIVLTGTSTIRSDVPAAFLNALPTSVAGRGGAVALATGDIAGLTTACLAARPAPWAVWKPWGNGLSISASGYGSTYAKASHTYIWTAEFEALPLGIQFAFANSTASWTWTVQQGVVAPSSQYGAGVTPGVTPYDESGAAVTALQPVTFNNAGAGSNPYPGIGAFAGGNQGPLVVSVIAATTASGQAVLALSNAQEPDTEGSLGKRLLQTGMYASDNLGNITPGTKIQSISGNNITLTGNIAGNITAGQVIFFAWEQLTLSATVPACTNAPEHQLIWSDFVPFQGFRRIDGPILPGMAASGANVPAGATVLSVTANSVTLSATPSAQVASQTAVTFGQATFATAALASGYVLAVASTANLQQGQAVSGPNIAAGAIVWEVLAASGSVRLSKPSSAAVGDLITFSVTATTNAGSTGAVLPFPSTTGKFLVTARFNVSGGTNINAWVPGYNWVTSEAALGLPLWQSYQGGNGNDGVNFPSTLSNSAGGVSQNYVCPVYGARVLTASRGWVIMEGGDSHICGDTTGSLNANFVRLAAAQLSTPQRPVSVWNAATGGTLPSTFLPQLWNPAQVVKPAVTVLQGYTHNTNDQPDGLYLSQAMAVADGVWRGWLGNFIIVDELPRQSAEVGLVQTAAATVNSASVTLADYPQALWLNGTNSYPVQSVNNASVPPGTTAIGNWGSNALALGVPLSIPAGTILALGRLLVASSTTNSTSVTLTDAAAISGTYNVSGTGIVAGDTIAITANSTAATLSNARSLVGGSYLQIGNSDSMLTGSEAATGIYNQGSGYSSAVLKAMDLLADATGTFLPANSTDGIHANDVGHAVLAAALMPLLTGMGVGAAA